MSKLTPEQRAEVVRLCQEGKSQAAVALRFGVTPQAVTKFVRRAGVPAAAKAPPITDNERAAILALYETGLSAPDIAQKLGRSDAGVGAVLRRAGVMRDRAQTRRGRVAQETRDQFAVDYQAGQTLQAIAAAHKTTVQIVLSELKRRDVARRSGGRRSRFHDQPDIERAILDYYAAGHLVGTLAEWYSCSRDAIEQVLHRYKVVRRPNDTGGYSWIDKNGRPYVFRSSWELKTAAWFDQQNITWDYERETYRLADGRSYTPDFWVFEADTLVKLVDVKGVLFPASAARIDAFRAEFKLPLEVWAEADLNARNILAASLPEHTIEPLRSTRRIKPAMRQHIVALYKGGWTVNEIEEAIGVGHTAIDSIISEAGVKQDKSERRRLRACDQSTRDRIADLYASGCGANTVSKRLGVSLSIVQGEVKRRGLTRGR